MKIKLIIYFLIFAAISCNAQLLDIKPADINVGPTHFNSAIVKQNKIKSIQVVMVDKPDGAIIIDKGATQGYDFDENGRVIRYYYTILNNIKAEEMNVPEVRRGGRILQNATTRTINRYINDTIFANIYYDNQNRIISKRTQTGDYYDAYYYEYNEQGQIKKEMHFRETNISENRKVFRLGVQTVLSLETFQYTALTSTQLKKQCFNDEGREYKKGIINYDVRGNKLSESYSFIVSWMREGNSYQYDTNNYLKEKVLTNNQSGNLEEHSVFENNPKGVLLSEKKFTNGVLLNEISYLYDENFSILRSQVNRDHKNASIGIVKYAYSFY